MGPGVIDPEFMSDADERAEWARIDAELNELKGDMDIASVFASVPTGNALDLSALDRELEALGSSVNGNVAAPIRRKSSEPPPIPVQKTPPQKRPSSVPPPLPSKRPSSKPPSEMLLQEDSFPRAAMFDTPPPPRALTPVPPVAAAQEGPLSSAPPARISSVPSPTAAVPETNEPVSFERHSLLSEEDLFAEIGASHPSDATASSGSLVPDEDDTSQMPPQGRGEPTEPVNLFESLEPEFAALLGVSSPHDEEESTTQWAPTSEEQETNEGQSSAANEDFELMVDETRLSEPAADPTDNEGGALPEGMTLKESATDIQLEPPISPDADAEDTKVSKEPKKGFFKKLFG